MHPQRPKVPCVPARQRALGNTEAVRGCREADREAKTVLLCVELRVPLQEPEALPILWPRILRGQG